MERCDAGLSFWIVGSGVHENANAPRPLGRRLRPHHERPRRRAAEQRDERAAIHSITSSAATSSLSGIVRPIAFAACRLMSSSNLLDCTTGRSAGLAPFKILPV